MRALTYTILDLVGNTPLVRIRRLNTHKKVVLLAKMEAFNPGGSVKDRVALSMVEGAEQRGELTRDRVILEASSGNTGIGLALVSAVKGYRCLIAMSESASLERRQIMQAYGAEILLTPAALGTDGAIEAVYKMAREAPERYFCTDQFNNPDNPMAHYSGTAPEIWEQTGGAVNVVVATMGTTGTLMGLTRRFRELNSRVRVVGVEPFLGHRLQGLKNMKESYRPGIFDKRIPDAIVNVGDDEALDMTRRLAREEGIFAGMSSGAAVVAALAEASMLEEGVVVVILPDGGERYLSTGVFQASRCRCRGGKSALRFTNTLARRKEVFEPIAAGKAGIYSCGPTVYEFAHLGLCRRVVVADLLRRTLESKGYEVTHVMNITDLDDKTIRAAMVQEKALPELTDFYSQAFLDDVAALNVTPATHYPRASAHVAEMMEVARRLLEAGYAYVKHGSVYFDISKLASYGRLSKVDLSKIHVGRTVDLDDYEKDSPVDFTLFKRVTLDELKRGIGFETPWGQARPGWHIECVAMAMKYLGDYFDIHTSGSDLVFPHHENEIAMATALTRRPLAKMWIHSALVFVDSKKMSRSAGNVVTLRDLLVRGFTGRQARFFLVRTNYRKPLTFSYRHLEEATRALQRLDGSLSEMQAMAAETGDGAGEPSEEIRCAVENRVGNFLEAMYDDLNVSQALGALYGLIRDGYTLMSTRSRPGLDANHVLEGLARMDRILGVLDVASRGPGLAGEIRDLIGQRDRARAERDWEMADRLRLKILDLGVEVIDTPNGVRWRWIKKN